MSNLYRTQIYIEENQMQQLKLEAERENTSVSRLIRRAIKSFLQNGEKSADWNNDPLTGAIGSIALPVDDASTGHDRYLYGKKKRT